MASPIWYYKIFKDINIWNWNHPMGYQVVKKIALYKYGVVLVHIVKTHKTKKKLRVSHWFTIKISTYKYTKHICLCQILKGRRGKTAKFRKRLSYKGEVCVCIQQKLYLSE